MKQINGGFGAVGLISVAVGALLLASHPALAKDTLDKAAVTSPDGQIQVTLTTDNDGRPLYSVSRQGKPVIDASRLGFLFADAPKMQRGFEITGIDRAKHDDTWTQPWGQWQSIRNHYTQLVVHLREADHLKRRMDVTFRVFDGGLGFRLTLPKQPAMNHANIAEELTQFSVAKGGTAWWIPGGEWNRYEYLYNETPLAAVSVAHTPLTARLDDGTRLSIHEAALVDYSGMWLKRVGGTTLRTELAPGSGAAKVSADTPLQTPWRTITLTDSTPALYTQASQIELNLNEPNQLGDVSWIKPGKFVGICWNMIKGQWSWGTGPDHGATTEHAREYIDFAAQNGFDGVLVEGWNVGWNGDWLGHGEHFNFTQATDDFDIDALADYAQNKGVRLIGHHETGGDIRNYERQLDAAFAYAQDHGERVVKTGYVTDAGDLAHGEGDAQKREWHDGQYRANHAIRVLKAAAKHHIAIDEHEPIKATGLRRTYPNAIAREGARGMEYNAWTSGEPAEEGSHFSQDFGGKNPPSHVVNLVFTRMLAGPMDFTPGLVSLTGASDSPLPSTLAKQLALYVVLYSPMAMAADTPAHYAEHPKALEFIRNVPTDWVDTRVLNGKLGDYVTFARRARNDHDWYLGSVTDEHTRRLDIPLDFLDKGQTYTAKIYRDGDSASLDGDQRFDMAVEEKTVRASDTLTLRVVGGGGAAVQLMANEQS